MVEAMKKSIAEGSILSPTLSDEEFAQLVSTMIKECETQEGLKRVESFQKLQAQMNEVTRRAINPLLISIIDLSFDNLDHPLTTVAAISKSMLRKILTASDDKAFVKQLQDRAESKGGYKSRYLAMNLLIDFIEPWAYISERPGIIKEIIESTIESVTSGKYVLNFFEALLKKALQKGSSEKEKKWFDIWIEEYLSALKSENEALREAVCTLITPIVIKINKNSLPLILSTLLQPSETQALPMQVLEQLLTLLKIARLNKMLIIDEKPQSEGQPLAIRLEKKCQEALMALKPDLPEFNLPQEVLMRLVLSEEFKTALACVEIVAAETKQSMAVTRFEYQLIDRFVRHCLRTTFPEFRQKYIKAVKMFLIRVRTATDKDIKKYIANGQASEQLQEAIQFLEAIISFIEQNLYLDKPVEGALPYFEVLRIIFELFGDFEYKLRITQVYPPCQLLSKIGFFSEQRSKSVFIFLINSMKSTWAQVRLHAFTILTRFPDNYAPFNDKAFVNDVLVTAASELANNPKAMLAEASALFHNLLFKKCLSQLEFVAGQPNKELAFLRHIVQILNKRVKTFQVALIKEGKKEALLHGYLSFFKHLFEEFKIGEGISKEELVQWRQFVKELMETSLQIGQACKGLLSNNGLMAEGEDIGDIQVDCRGHPIKMDGMGAEGDMEDYENFILVGVWLAVKENGLTQLNLLKWLNFPISREDDSKFLLDEDILLLQEHFLDLLFNFKHRGAIEKAAETFSLFCVKLLESPEPFYRSLPGLMLDRALEKITTENLSTVLRRSAGIPPTIIAILRAEPISSEPVLLNRAIGFLLELAKTADRDDSKIHALNIMRFIFQDSMLRHDIQKFITPAMILATESFSSNNWSIRNSALMAFTSLTKRLLNNLHVQDQDLARTRGLSVWEFLHKYHDLSEYFLGKLREGLDVNKGKKKEDKEKEDLVIFSILLLISRLIPSFQFVELKSAEESFIAKNRETSIAEYVELIKQYSGNSTYFVRKISAQAILPLIKFDEYVQKEIPQCFSDLISSLEQSKKLRQNNAHGLMVRINVFLSAYLQYRDITTKQLGPGHYQDLESHRKNEENILTKCFEEFQIKLNDFEKLYSRVTVALFVKTYTKLIQNLPSYKAQDFILKDYIRRFDAMSVQFSSNSVPMTGDEQILLQEVSRFLVVVSFRRDTKEDAVQVHQVFTTIVSGFTESYSDFVYTFLTQFESALKKTEGKNSLKTSLCEYISVKALPQMLERNEKYCKVTEMLLKILFTTFKGERDLEICSDFQFSEQQEKLSVTLFKIMNKFVVNPRILSHIIKLLAVVLLNCKDLASKGLRNGDDFDLLFQRVAALLMEYSPMQHKEQVRIAVSKALAKLLPLLIIEKLTFGDELKRFQAQLAMMNALVLLLNDEQPDIRYYLCESDALQQNVVDHKEAQPWAIQGGSVRVNDQFIVELLFSDFSERIRNKDDPTFQKLYVRDFLINQWLLSNPYREHLEKNFEDKIFFFEPLNKFYDLLWVKKLAYNEILKFNLEIREVSEDKKLANLSVNLSEKISEYYSSKNILRHNSINLESIAQELMLRRVITNEKNQGLNEAEAFIRSI